MNPPMQRQNATVKSDSLPKASGVLQRSATVSSPINDVPPIVHDVLNSPGQALEPSTRGFMESRFNHDFSQVRVHTDSRAADSARALQAQAFTVGRNVVFGQSQVAPHSPAGQNLIAHELTHVVQQQGAASSPQAFSVVSNADPLEHQAATVADRVMAGGVVAPGEISSAGSAIARRVTAPVAPSVPRVAAPPPQAAPPQAVAPTTGTAPSQGGEPVSLMNATFNPSPELESQITSVPNEGTLVPVHFGTLARGQISVHKNQNGSFSTKNNSNQGIDLSVSVLEPLRRAGIAPQLVINIASSQITGHVGVRTGDKFTSAEGMKDFLVRHSDLLGWAGFDLAALPNPVNELSGGSLKFMLSDFPFTVGGFVHGTGSFGFENQTTTFTAAATINVPKLAESNLKFTRADNGQLSAHAEVPVSIANFSGSLSADYGNGTVDIQGTVQFEMEKMQGEVTLLVTDLATARNIARSQLAPEAMLPTAQPAADAPAAEGEARSGPRPGPRAVAGFGTVNFALTDWLVGQAQVVIDNEGHVTVVGKITPPQEVELFPQRDEIKPLFNTEVRTLYGVPLVGNVFLFANIGVEALAKIGPGKIHKIQVDGTYSTDPNVLQNFGLQASLNISAFAGLRLRAEGGAGAELLGHDIKAGVGINGLAGVRGYVEATPKIGFREVADPTAGKKGEFFVQGHMELAAQPFLGLSGDLFVELDSPWWSPAPDKKWTWPLGNLEYPLPGEFGIGADVDYVIGSGQVPEVQFGAVNFSADKFMTDMLNDHVPPKSHGDQEQPGKWDEAAQGGALPAEAQAGEHGTHGTDEAATGQHAPEDGHVPAPQKQKQWLEGIHDIGDLAARSQRDPLDQSEITSALAAIKTRHGFSILSAVQSGDVWDVSEGMSPVVHDKHIKADVSDASSNTSSPTAENPSETIEIPNLSSGDIVLYKRSTNWEAVKFVAFNKITIPNGILPAGQIQVVELHTFGKNPGIIKVPVVNFQRVWKNYDGKYSVNYKSLNNERAVGAKATLGLPLPPGQNTTSRKPPGWDELPDGKRHRGHLLMRALGGSAREDNIVSLYSEANASMLTYEMRILNAVEAGEVVQYDIIAIYEGLKPVPRGITIDAQGDRGLNISVTFPNIP